MKKQKEITTNQEIKEPIEQVSDTAQILTLQDFKITVIHSKKMGTKILKI